MKKKILAYSIAVLMLLTGCEKNFVSCETIALEAVNLTESFAEYKITDMSYSNWAYFYEEKFSGLYSDCIQDYYYIYDESLEKYNPCEIVIARMDSEENAALTVEFMLKYKENKIAEDKKYITEIIEVHHITDYASMDSIDILENGIIAQYEEYVFYLLCENSEEVYQTCLSLVK